MYLRILGHGRGCPWRRGARMVRLFVVGMILLLVAEVVAALFFLAGYFWIGGVLWGLVLAAAAILLFFILPWVGDLVFDFDSRPQEVNLKLSWWGRVRVTGKEAPELRLRLFGIIPYRKRFGKKPEAAKPEPKPDSADGRVRTPGPAACTAGRAPGRARSGVERRALTVTINAPAETDVVDQIVAGIIGKASAGTDTVARAAGRSTPRATALPDTDSGSGCSGVVPAGDGEAWKVDAGDQEGVEV